MEILDGNKEKNILNAINILKSLKESKNIPQIVCFPELFTTGYDLKNVEKYAEKLEGETLKNLAEISKNNFIVIGTILEKQDDNYYNTAFILDKNGQLLGKYQKIHLFSPMLEKEYLTPGNKISTFIIPELDNIKIGMAICYDLRFPELLRTMALDGAKIIFLPSEFPSPKKKVWKTLIKARAIENQVYVIGVNRVGKGNSDDFFGTSIVTDGENTEHLGETPEVKIFTIDIKILNQIREKIPVFDDRRSDLYENWRNS